MRRKPLALLLSLAGVVCLFQTASAAYCTPTTVPACWPTKVAIAEFAASLIDSSDVNNPDKTPDKFWSDSMTMNTLKSSFPGLIVTPGSEADLRKAVLFANKYKIRIVMRCSGHDFNGRSNGRGAMVIKTGKLNAVEYDERSQLVSFGAGANHGDIYSFLEPYKRVYVGGQSKTVCPAGCLAGGCHGPLSRQYGLGADNIREIRFLLYNGTIVTATPSNCYSQLFNAYLGAGQNTFAIALSFKGKTYPAPPKVLTMIVKFSLFDPTHPDKPHKNVFYDFFMNLAWFDSMPRQLAGYINFDGSETVTAQFVYTGCDAVGAYNKLESLLESPYMLDLGPITNYSSISQYAADNYPPPSEIWQRKFITNAFLPRNQDQLDLLTQAIVTGKPYMWLWFVYGGAVPEGAAGSVPAGMRNAVYQAVLGTQWNDPNEDEGRMQYVQQYLDTLYGMTSASYNNEWTTYGNLYNNMPDWKTRFYNDYASLLKVKQKYDPCNLFTAKYGVGSDLAAATCSC